jgi:hypothetical protein
MHSRASGFRKTEPDARAYPQSIPRSFHFAQIAFMAVSA